MPTRAIGFTGSRQGLTAYQEGSLAVVLDRLKARAPGIPQAHHGDCVGGDATFHRLAIAAGLPVWIHPPTVDRHRAFCDRAEWTYPPRPYMARNADIVTLCDVLIACPSGSEESQPRSGTWATVRMARKIGRDLILLDASGAGVLHRDDPL